MPWPFVRRWNTNREGVLAGPPSPLAIFDQYYKNQPTDFLRKILPPCVAEYFIGVHPGTHPSPIPFLFQPPALARRGGQKHRGRRKEIGRGSGTRFRFASSRAADTLGMPSFNGEHSCGQYGIFSRYSWPFTFLLRGERSLLSALVSISLSPLDRWRFVTGGATVNVSQLPSQPMCLF